MTAGEHHGSTLLTFTVHLRANADHVPGPTADGIARLIEHAITARDWEGTVEVLAVRKAGPP